MDLPDSNNSEQLSNTPPYCRYGVQFCEDCRQYIELTYTDQEGNQKEEKRCKDEWEVELFTQTPR